MVSGTLTLAWLLLAAGTPPADTVYLNQAVIKLPLDIKESQRQLIRQLTLYVSADQGKTWQQYANCAPDQDGFKFYAPKDGEYWFNVDETDQQGRHTIEDVPNAPPAQKVVIDTLKPQARIVSARRQGELVEVAWEIQEDHPDLASLRLEYRPAGDPAGVWYPAPVEPQLNGKSTFRPNGPGPLVVRLQMRDLANNQTLTEPVEVQSGSGVTNAALASAGTGGNPIVPVGGTGNPDPLLGGGSSSKGPGQGPPPDEPKSRGELPLPPPPGGDLPPGGEGAGRPVATTEASARGAGLPADLEHRPGTRRLPPLQVVKSRQVTLAYALDKVGPSGVGSVELWLTRDDGLTWERYAEDPEVKAAAPNGRHERLVQLPPEDGVYGITLVVRSRAGLGKAPPRPGDVPQMRIEVDTVPPEAQLFAPSPAPGRRDALVLTWKAADRNLARDPITLQWAEQAGGSWHTIADRLANDGRYVWKLPANLPERVYLRLLARDTAGNEGVAETKEPQLVDLSEPEGVLLGVVGAAGGHD